MKIAVEGCAHGELEMIYDTIKLLEEKEDIKVDLLICCGDFQASRNEGDLHCMAIPPKYYDICSFYKYYTGEKEAPILTIFIGGNHEASNHLQELPYGGWVAPKIYYLGYAGVVNIAGIRIGGLSGIYKGQDYLKGHFEKPPYDNSTKRSVYHIRNLEVFRLKQLSQPIDIFLSHDWPTGIWEHGDVEQLLRFKPFFKPDIESEKLGSKPCRELLGHLQPQYWFAAHLHCKFAALVPHSDKKSTKFLALDKCLPRRRFLQITDIPHDPNLKVELNYDLEWLTILHSTNHLLSVKGVSTFMPGLNPIERWQFTPSEEEKAKVLSKFSNDLSIPNNFVKTAEGYDPHKKKHMPQPPPQMNPQTTSFCGKLGVDDPLVLLEAFVNDTNVELEEKSESCEEESDFDTFINNTPSKLSLSLPEPKFDQGNDNESCADISERVNSTLSAICEHSSISAEDEKSVNPETDTKSEGSDFKVADTSSPLPKKFKRRNASIYGSEGT